MSEFIASASKPQAPSEYPSLSAATPARPGASSSVPLSVPASQSSAAKPPPPPPPPPPPASPGPAFRRFAMKRKGRPSEASNAHLWRRAIALSKSTDAGDTTPKKKMLKAYTEGMDDAGVSDPAQLTPDTSRGIADDVKDNIPTPGGIA